MQTNAIAIVPRFGGMRRDLWNLLHTGARERLPQYTSLDSKLLSIARHLQMATAADAEMRTARLDALRRRLNHAHNLQFVLGTRRRNFNQLTGQA